MNHANVEEIAMMTTVIGEIGVARNVMTVTIVETTCAGLWANGWSELVKCVNVPKEIHELEASQVETKAAQALAEADPVVVSTIQAQVAADHNGVAMVADRRGDGDLAGVKWF